MNRKCDECGKKLPVKALKRQRYCDQKCRNFGKQRGICATCGGLRSYQPRSGSLPEGRGRCQTCRKAARQAHNDRIKAARTKTCATCGNSFEAHHAGVLYCNDECRIVAGRKRGRYGKPKGKRPGYGNEHKKERKRQLEEFVPGTLCGLCLEPMFADQKLDLDHSDPRSLLRGDPGDRLTHSVCNRREGARHTGLRRGCDCEVCTGEYAAFVGQRCRRLPSLPPPKSPRPCRHCGNPFDANGPAVFCSDDCRIESKPPVLIHIRDCTMCGEIFVTRTQRKTQCGQQQCAIEANARKVRDRYRTSQGLPVNPSEPTKGWRVRSKPKELQHI